MRGLDLRLRVWASVALLVLFPVLVLGILVGLLVAAGFAFQYTSRGGGELLLLTIPVAAAFVSAVRGLRQLRNLPPHPGLEVTPQQEPLLWAEIQGLARALGEQPPARLVIDGAVNAAVTEAGGRREMVVGLPLLTMLNRAQLRAILAHEMGHFAQGHTRGSRFVLRSQYLVRAVLAHLDPSVIRWLLVHYHRLYSRVSASVRREHEREADLWSARLAGPEPAAQALLRLRAVDLAWSQVDEHYAWAIGPKGPRGSLNQALTSVFNENAETIASFLEQHPEESSPYDSHPPTPERVAVLQGLGPLGTSPLPLDRPEAPAWTWLADPGARMAQVEATQIRPGAETALSDWEVVLTTRIVEDAAEAAGRLTAVLQRVSPQAPPTLESVLRVLAAGDGQQLVDPLLRGDIPRDRRAELSRDHLRELLRDTILTVLAGSGRVTVRPDFTSAGPWHVLVLEAGGQWTPWPFDDLVTAAVDSPGSVTATAEALTAAGIDLTTPVKPAEQLAGAIATAALTGARVTLKGPIRRLVRTSGRYDVLVYDEGVLLRRAPARIPLHRQIILYLAPSRTYERETQVRIVRLMEQIGDRPQAHAAGSGGQAIWVPYSAVTKHTWRNAGYGMLMNQLLLTDGSRIRMLSAPFSVWINDPMLRVAAAVR